MTMLLDGASGGWSELRQSYGDGATIDAATTDPFEILDAVDVPIVVLGRDFAIAGFNRAAAELLSLAQSDVGRSPGSISMLSGLPAPWCAEVFSAQIATRYDIRVAERSFVLRIAPRKRSDGQVSGAVLTFTNVTAFRASIDQAIYEREYTKTILNTVTDPLVVLNEDLHVRTANRAFYLMFRVSREAIQGAALDQLCDRALDVPGLLTQLKETIASDRSLESFEIECDLPEIGRRTLLLNACPFAVPGSSARLALLSFHDITAHKKGEERMRMLAHEVDHRAKNQLAILQAMVHFTQGDTPSAIKAAIEGRIRALSNAHTLLAQSRWTGADMRSLVNEELSPYYREGTSRAVVHGPNLVLQPQTAQLIAMVLHELATNAAKYGALSIPEGRVKIEWLHAVNGKLILRWTETDGPLVTPPSRQGFGTRLLHQVVRAQLNGETRFDWRAEGLACEIEIPAYHP
jgi:two-component sensor histidine kinase